MHKSVRWACLLTVAVCGWLECEGLLIETEKATALSVMTILLEKSEVSPGSARHGNRHD